MRELEFHQQDNAVLLNGPLTRETAGEAWRNRSTWLGNERTVLLDLSGVETVDSAGLALLIQVKAELAAADRDLALQNVNKQLLSFAEVSGVTELLSLSYSA